MPEQLRPNSANIAKRNTLRIPELPDFEWARSMKDKSPFFDQDVFPEYYQEAWDHGRLSYPACLFALAGVNSVVETMDHVEPGILSRDYGLSFALLGRNEKLIEAAIRSSQPANVYETICGPTPLFLAMALRRSDWILSIIDKGADVNHVYHNRRDATKCTPLYLAAQYADHEIMEILLTAGANPWTLCGESHSPNYTSYDTTTVHWLTRQGGDLATNFLPLLLSATADKRSGKPRNTVDDKGRSTLSYAAQHGYEMLVHTLIDYGAEWDNPADDQGMTPLEYAFQSGVAYTIQLWPSDGASPSTSSPSGETLSLHEAVVASDLLGVQTLLSSGVDATATNVCGNTALHEAIRRRNLEIVGCLLEWKDSQGQTMLMHDLRNCSIHSALSARKAEWAIREVLHITDYDFNIQDNDGVNVLMIAVSHKRSTIVGMLVRHQRVRLDLSNVRGETPLMIGERNSSNWSIMEWLYLDPDRLDLPWCQGTCLYCRACD